jgi:hypothetical protein
MEVGLISSIMNLFMIDFIKLHRRGWTVKEHLSQKILPSSLLGNAT